MVEAARKQESSTNYSRKTAVYLRVYDISGGAARTWSPILLGRRVEGVWHSGVECFGFEYFYGGGIVKMRPENVESAFGISPVKKHHLGHTELTRAAFEGHLQSIKPMFKREVYDLVNWNCNHFSDHVARHLVGKPIPSYILDLPHEVCKTFMGKILLNFIKMLQGGAAPVSVDDPEHPSKHLDGGHGGMVRRNSCPASPTRRRPTPSALTSRETHVAPGVLAADPSIYRGGRERSVGAVHRHSQRHKTVSEVRRKRPTTMNLTSCTTAVTTTTSATSSDAEKCTRLELIAGAPIGNEETAILFSPKHKRLYEEERDRYCSVRAAPRVVKMQTSVHNF